MMLKRSAHQKFLTLNPGTIAETNKTKRAFITNEKIPRVKILSGNVKRDIIGLMNIFMIPRSKATIRATVKPEIVTPGRI